MSMRESPSNQTAKLDPNTVKLARSYFEEVGKDINFKACNLSSTLDKLYTWEKKLYKEVKVNSFTFLFLNSQWLFICSLSFLHSVC